MLTYRAVVTVKAFNGTYALGFGRFVFFIPRAAKQIQKLEPGSNFHIVSSFQKLRIQLGNCLFLPVAKIQHSEIFIGKLLL